MLNKNIIAKCIRVEREKGTGKLLLIFEVIDPDFSKKIKEDMSTDFEFKISKYNLEANND